MASDATLERAYPYRTGWRVIGCGVLMLGTLGTAALVLIPFGYERVQNGQMPIGVAMVVGGLFGIPMLFMAALTLYLGIRDSISPPLLRVTPTSLLLPESMRGTMPNDASGEPKPDATVPHPEEIPFSAIRWVRREGPINPGSHKLVIVHDLAPTKLVIEQYMMRWGDFDELETVLRTAIPAAFAPAPPSPPTA